MIMHSLGSAMSGLNRAGEIGLLLVAATMVLIDAACRRHAVAPVAHSTPTAIATRPATRAAGEFVRSPRRIILNKSRVEIPLEFISNMPIVDLTLPNGSQHKLILDTGADSALISPQLVAARHLTTRPSDRDYRDATGSGSLSAVAEVDKLDLGVVRFEDFDADVSPLPVGADALLGWPVWRDLLVTIDYPRHMLALQQGTLPPPDGQTILPLRFDHDHLMVPVSFDRKEAWLNLDTGWGIGACVELTSKRAAELQWKSSPVPTIATNAPNGVSTEKMGRLNTNLVVGRYTFSQPVAGTNSGNMVDILGAAALANFSVTLDFHNMRARFDRPTDAPIASPSILVSGFNCDLRSDPLKVISVLPGSEADHAGLRVGDLLLKIDGKPALDGLLSHGDAPFVVQRKRDDQITTLTFPLTELVP